MTEDNQTTETKPEQPVTEVTSVAAEELKTGQEIPTPTIDELVARATASYIRNLSTLENIVRGHKGGSYHVSRRGMNRIMMSILQLPQDGLPVTLQGDTEKLAFALGQRIIADRFVITQHHIAEEMKRIKAAKEAKAAEQAKENTNEGVKNNEQVS
jgi:hypothetical protein